MGQTMENFHCRMFMKFVFENSKMILTKELICQLVEYSSVLTMGMG